MIQMKKLQIQHWLLLALFALALMTLGGCSSSDEPPQQSGATPNPYLASPLYAITHFDSSQSDSTPYGPPQGVFRVDPEEQLISYGGPINIMTFASTKDDYMWGVGTDHVAFIYKNNGKWDTVATIDAPSYPAPGLGPVAPETLKAFGELNPIGMTSTDMNVRLSDDFGAYYPALITNGVYSVVDRDNVLYANFGTGIYAFSLKDATDPSKGIQILHRLDDVGSIQSNPPDDLRLCGLTMTYDGYLIIDFSNGVAVIDREFNTSTAQFVEFGEDEHVGNSVAVDENNGIYVASDKMMRKLVWTGSKLSTSEADGAWSSLYDAPTDAVPPLVKFGLGTGSTPTLMGFGDDNDKLVVITDGCKQMKLVAFWRDNIPDDFVQKPGTLSRRIADQIPVTCGFSSLPTWIQSEQSVVVSDYGAFVVNNIPANADTMDIAHAPRILSVTLMGPIYDTCYGVERFRWDSENDEWASVWGRPDVSSTSMVPIHSQSASMALVNGYTPQNGWEVTGMDWNTGEIVHQTIFGRKNFGNGAYAILEYLDNDDLVFNSIVGPLRVHYGD